MISTKSIRKHFLGMPCMMGNVVGRIIGEEDGCIWQEFDGEKVPSIIKFSTPHGTITSCGRFKVNEITVEGLKKLLELENEVYQSNGKLYNGKLTDIDFSAYLDIINLQNTESSVKLEYEIINKHVSDIEIKEKTNCFSGNMDIQYGYESGWQHARDYYENNFVHPKNKFFIEDYKSFEVEKTENYISKENAEFIWSLMPTWIKNQPDGLNPTFYATLSAEGDKEISNKVKSILFNKNNLEDTSTEPLDTMSENEQAFMNEIDRYLYWSKNPNVLEIFRKYQGEIIPNFITDLKTEKFNQRTGKKILKTIKFLENLNSKFHDKIYAQIKELRDIINMNCTHKETVTEFQYIPGSYYDKSQNIHKKICTLCNKELDRKIQYGYYE